MSESNTTHDKLAERIAKMRGDRDQPPSITIVIPVNAQGDLQNVLTALDDCAKYDGKHHVEFILVVNNFDPDKRPREIEEYEQLGVRVVALPQVRRPGEAVGFSARIPGIRESQTEGVILFDADCRIPRPTALIDWYVRQFESGAGAAYSPVGYYDYEKCLSMWTRLKIHHVSRWIKRNVMRIPTTRGSNYAVRREVILELYEQQMLADEMNVGPTFKRTGHRVAYSGRRELTVLTSGRMFSPGWKRIVPYFWYRLRYNLRTLPVRVGVARHTGREKDPVRKYVNNRPIK